MEVAVSTNEVNTYTVSELEYIRETIENMNKFNQVEVLRILHKHKDIILNENKYGIHINLSELQNEVLQELNEFIQYVNTQEKSLQDVEKQKETYKNTYFSNNENKENS